MSASFRPASLFCVLAVMLATASPARAQPTGMGLHHLGETGPVLKDTNEDAVLDRVRARVVIPDSVRSAESIAAANIAARLGYETAAADLDPVVRASALEMPINAPVILIGLPMGAGAVDRSLPPGQGRVAVVQPTDRFPKGGVRVAGADASGMLAAAHYLAGRLPSLWRLDGPTITGTIRTTRDSLHATNLAVDSIRGSAAVVSRNRPGVVSLTLRVDVPDSSSAAQVVDRLRPADNRTTDGHPLHLPNVHAVNVRVADPEDTTSFRVQPETPWDTPSPEDGERPFEREFELHELYSIDGLFQDTNHDFVPDDMGGYLSIASSDAAEDLSALGMRLGLESAGLRWPLARPAGERERPETQGLPIFAGLEHPEIVRLHDEERVPGSPLQPGEGTLQFIDDAAGDAPALVLTGGDGEGLASVAAYTARRLPYLWEHGKGNYRLQRIDTDVRRFVQGQSGAGQVASGLDKLDTWLKRLQNVPLDSVHVTLAADSVPAPLDRILRQRVSDAVPDAAVAAETHPTRYGVGDSIIDTEFGIPWEGDTFWQIFRGEVLPKVDPGDEGRITLRLSEGPEQRTRLRRQIHAALAERGVDTTAVDVRVLSAYKQGFSWLVDEIAPAVQDRADDIGAIRITYHTLKESEEVRWQLIHSNTRWLQELYPVDAVLARDLGIADSLVTFEPSFDTEPIYRVEVQDQDGDAIHTDAFSPKYAVRPYFDHFPRHDSVRVGTGWLHAELGGETLVDRRIKTDLERFWDHFQQETVPKIVDYAMSVQDGDPRPDLAPFFDELRMHVQLSEPNYRLGIQEHTISATEALHEDLYFHMLALFTLMGNRYNVGPLDYPGRILPYIAPPVHGEPGQARIAMTGKERARPELRLAYTTEDGQQVIKNYLLPNIESVPAPKLRGLRTEAGREGLSRLRFDVEVEADTSVYEAMKERAGEAALDRAYPSAERLGNMLEHLRLLQGNGVFEGTLSYDRVGELLVRFLVADTDAVARTVTLPRTVNPTRTQNPTLPATPPESDDAPIVQWETPIPPAEANALMSTLSTFPEVTPYYMETSFLGHDIFAMDLLPHHEARYVSQAKLNAQKPTLYLNAREDGNEVSSTSYVLRLAEQLATDPGTRAYLDSVNLVIHPMSNPDGAQVAYEMQQANPDFMLHAGYYAALGPSMDDQEDAPDPLYPEATVEPRLRHAWLPDIFMNLHGYPSHEWVQYFAGYSAWVFSRNGTARSWWPTRGYFLTGFDWIDDPDHPALRTAAFAPLDTMTAALAQLDTLMTLSRNEYARYHKYRQPEDDFGEYFRNGVRVHSAIKGDELDGAHPSDVRDPRITPFSITTEAQDETARGDWLRLQARAGLTAVKAALRYLYHGQNRVVQEASAEAGTIRRWVHREKPVLPLGSNQ
jgi:hypothetical protein